MMDAGFTIPGKRWVAFRSNVARNPGPRPMRYGSMLFSYIPLIPDLTLERLRYPTAWPWATAYICNRAEEMSIHWEIPLAPT